MLRFEGKFAVISGGASGMGAATAKRFVEEGGSVITLDINEESGNKISEEIGESCEFFKADVSKAEDWKRLENHLGDRFNKVTSVINAAGISEPGTIEDETIEHWERVHAINWTSVFLGCKLNKTFLSVNDSSINWFGVFNIFLISLFIFSYKYLSSKFNFLSNSSLILSFL